MHLLHLCDNLKSFGVLFFCLFFLLALIHSGLVVLFCFIIASSYLDFICGNPVEPGLMGVPSKISFLQELWGTTDLDILWVYFSSRGFQEQERKVIHTPNWCEEWPVALILRGDIRPHSVSHSHWNPAAKISASLLKVIVAVLIHLGVLNFFHLF